MQHFSVDFALDVFMPVWWIPRCICSLALSHVLVELLRDSGSIIFFTLLIGSKLNWLTLATMVNSFSVSCLGKMRRKIEIIGHLVVCRIHIDCCTQGDKILFWEAQGSTLFITCWALLHLISPFSSISAPPVSLSLETLESSLTSPLYHLLSPVALKSESVLWNASWSCLYISILPVSLWHKNPVISGLDRFHLQEGWSRIQFCLFPHITKSFGFKTSIVRIFSPLLSFCSEVGYLCLQRWHLNVLIPWLFLSHPQSLLEHLSP